MAEPHFGVIIDKGPQNWQVLQQLDGHADISLSGRLFYPEQRNETEEICARVVDENTGATVCPYVKTRVSGNTWSLLIPAVPAGGPYRIETCMNFDVIKTKRGDVIHHVGVGDLYLIAGQSNAMGVGKDAVNDPPEPGIHMLRSNGRWDMASHPLADNTGTIHPVNREDVQVGHSPWLNFARQLRARVRWPIGLLPTAQGGTALSAWHLADNGYLYRNMLDILRMAGGRVRGVLWYQGCTDAFSPPDAATYLERFRDMVGDMRRDIGEDLPILTVQLNKCTCVRDHPQLGCCSWGLVREAQRQAACTIPGVYMVPSIDLPVCDGIHNRSASNLVIGERVAQIALKALYGFSTLCFAPDATMAKMTGPREITVWFNHVRDHINTDLIPLSHFPLSARDEQGPLSLVDYMALDNTLVLSFDRDIGRNAAVDGSWEMDASGHMPYDVDSYLPITPFYNLRLT